MACAAWELQTSNAHPERSTERFCLELFYFHSGSVLLTMPHWFCNVRFYKGGQPGPYSCVEERLGYLYGKVPDEMKSSKWLEST